MDMTLKEMICLNIRIKKNDNMNGKRLEKTIIDFLMKAKVLGAIVWLGLMDLAEEASQQFI